ncbi:b6e03640-164d-45ea-920d-1fe7f4aa5169 [Thermothielavioides terrestris]
MAFRL